MRACDVCRQDTPEEDLIPVEVYDEDESHFEDVCPACVADLIAEEFTGVGPEEA